MWRQNIPSVDVLLMSDFTKIAPDSNFIKKKYYYTKFLNYGAENVVITNQWGTSQSTTILLQGPIIYPTGEF